jgi:RHS repeat-associated protein
LGGNVTMVTDPLSRVTQSFYDANNRVTARTDPLVATATTAYDAAGNVTAVTDPLKHTTTIAYDADNRATTSTDPLARVTTTAYDAAGEVTAVTDPLGNTTTTAYDGVGRVTQVTAPLTATTTAISTMLYDAVGNVTVSVDPLVRRTTSAYDALYRVTTVTNALNQMVTSAYDAADNVTASTNALGFTSAYQYDAANQQTVAIDPLGRPTTTAYDAAGNVTSVDDPRGKFTVTAYDADNRPTTVTDQDGNTTTSLYDALGNLTDLQDPKGNWTTYAYDALSRRTSTTDPDDNLATVTYDWAGNILAAGAFSGKTTRFAYDAANQQTSATDPMGNTTTNAYDAAGNLTTTTNPLNFVSTFAFDASHRRTAVTDPTGQTSRSTFDAVGNMTAATDPSGKTTTFLFDVLNRQTSVIDPNGNRTTSLYDAVGNLTQVTTADSHTTGYRYDGANRRIATADGNGKATTLGYDGQDNVTSVTDPDGNPTAFGYDSDGLKTSATDPLGKTTTYAYDGDTRLTSVTDPLGRVMTYSYDKDGHETGETWKNADGSVQNVLTFTYDTDGNQLTASNGAGTYTFTYDANNRVSVQQGLFGLTLTYTYDAAGNRTLVQDSLGGTINSIYDKRNELTSRQFNDTSGHAARFDWAYNARSQVTTMTRFNDMAGTQSAGTTTYAYDTAGRTTGITHLNAASSVLASYAYQYTPGGLLSAQTVNGGTTTFGYDGADQLVSINGGPTIGYDAAGNRTSGTTIGTGNQLQADASATYAYDAAGNEVGKTLKSTGEKWAYQYDDANHLVSAADTSTTGVLLARVTYTYDALGRRVETDSWTQTSGAVAVTRSGYDGDNVAADLNGSNALVARHLFGDGVDQVVAAISASGSGAAANSWDLSDWQGSVRDVMNSSGAVVDHRVYDPFGNLTSETNPAAGDRYAYAGREWDAVTGLSYNRARWYDPGAQRWTSRDPLEYTSGDANLYRYVHNDPTNFTDPTGLWDWAGDIASILPDSTVNYLASSDSAWIGTAANYSAGVADTLTGGATSKFRSALGYDDVVDYQSDAYRYGAYTGQAINIALMAATPAGWAAVAVRGVNLASTASGLLDAGAAALQGDFSAAGMAALNAGLARLRGAGSPCTAATRAASVAQRAMAAYGVAQGAIGAAEKFADGDILGGVLDLAQSGVSAKRLLSACFAAGTPLFVSATEAKPIEEFRVGDVVLSRDEYNVEGEVAPRVVEEVFRRLGKVIRLRLGGQEIGTSAEHPFWVVGRGWTPAGEVRVGNRVTGFDNQETVVDGVVDADEYAVLYNLRVAEYHTYFVGTPLWGFSAWAHNAKCVNPTALRRTAGIDVNTAKIAVRYVRNKGNQPAINYLVSKGVDPAVAKRAVRAGKSQAPVQVHNRRTEYPSDFSPGVRDRVYAKFIIPSGPQAGMVRLADGTVLPRNQTSIEHIYPVADHWRDTGRYSNYDARFKWYNDESNLTVYRGKTNSSEGATKQADGHNFKDYQQTGPGYSYN